jgi:2-iminobutanoate/2-iminopropanoate deaminase
MTGERREAVTSEAPTPRFSYSQGVAVGGLLFVSGQIGIDPATRTPAEGFEARVRQALANVDAIAQAAGGRLQNAVRVGVFLEDLDRIADMDAIYREYFAEPRPARTTVQAGLRGNTVEIDAIIAVPPGP